MADGQTRFDETRMKQNRAEMPVSARYVGSGFRVSARHLPFGARLNYHRRANCGGTPFPFVPIGLPIVILGVVLLGRNSV